MKVRIKAAATYSKFGLPHGKVGAQNLVKGDLVDFPDDYAREIIASGMAEKYVEPIEKSVEPASKPRRRYKPKSDTKRRIPDVSAEEAFGIGKKKD